MRLTNSTRKALAAGAVLAALAFASPTSGSHSIASFYTPDKAAYCKFHVPLEYIVTSVTALECWTPNDGFTVVMRPRTRPTMSYERTNKWRFARSIRRLTFRQDWWGSEMGLSVDDFGNPFTQFREGTGTPRGSAHYRCRSRSNGLTCRNRAGHGWWLGRFRGYRIF